MLSQADTLAPHFPLPGSVKAQRMTATSGRQCLKLLHKKNLLMSFAKTFMVTSQWASTRCYLTWRAKTTPASHLLLELVPSMRPTGDKGSLSSREKMWPTPTTQEIEHPDMELSKTGRRLTKDGKNSHSLNLADSVKMAGHKDGQLNPTWVEWLMGFPTGWTDLNPSEMPYYPKSSRKSAKQSSRQNSNDA